MEVLEFVQTRDSKQFESFIVELQEYVGNDNIQVYNVCVECIINSNLSKTLDIFESKVLNEAEEFYKNLVDNIATTNFESLKVRVE